MNVASIILLKRSKGKMFDKTKAFQKIATRINFVDLSFVIYLTILLVGDLVYKERIVLKERQWTAGPFCFTAFAIALNFWWLSPPMSGFLSLSRFMVVLHPLDTQFKESSFVRKITTKIALSVVVLSTCVCILQYCFAKMPLNICVPLFDPTGLSVIIQIIVWFTVIQQYLTCIFTIVLSIKLTQEVTKSRNQTGAAASPQKSNKPITIQLTTLVASNMVSRVPSGLIFLVVVYKSPYPIDMILWTILVIVPLNSIVTPAVFVFTTARKHLDQK